jgi:hypothetical protein
VQYAGQIGSCALTYIQNFREILFLLLWDQSTWTTIDKHLYPGYEILTAIHVGVSHITSPAFGKGVLVKVAIGKMDVSTGSLSAKKSMRCNGRGRCNQWWNGRGAGGYMWDTPT